MKKIPLLVLILISLISCEKDSAIVTNSQPISLENYLLEVDHLEQGDSLMTYYVVDSALLRNNLPEKRIYTWKPTWESAEKVSLFYKVDSTWVLQSQKPKTFVNDKVFYFDEFQKSDSFKIIIQSADSVYFSDLAIPHFDTRTENLNYTGIEVDLTYPERPEFILINDVDFKSSLWYLYDGNNELVTGIESPTEFFRFYIRYEINRSLTPDFVNPTLPTASNYSIKGMLLDSNNKAIYQVSSKFSN